MIEVRISLNQYVLFPLINGRKINKQTQFHQLTYEEAERKHTAVHFNSMDPVSAELRTEGSTSRGDDFASPEEE